MQQLHHLHFTGKIQKSRWFVQKDKRSLLCQCLCYHHFLTFTITKCLNHPSCQVFNLHQSHRILHNAFILFIQPPPKACIGTTPQSYQLFHQHIANLAFFSQDHPNNTGQFLIRIHGDFFVQDFNAAIQFGLKSRKRAQQCRLSHPVCSQQACQFTATYGSTNVRSHYFSVVFRRITDG